MFLLQKEDTADLDFEGFECELPSTVEVKTIKADRKRLTKNVKKGINIDDNMGEFPYGKMKTSKSHIILDKPFLYCEINGILFHACV